MSRELPALSLATVDFTVRPMVSEKEFQAYWIPAVAAWFCAELYCALRRRDGAAIHDLVSRTRVVKVE